MLLLSIAKNLDQVLAGPSVDCQINASPQSRTRAVHAVELFSAYDAHIHDVTSWLVLDEGLLEEAKGVLVLPETPVVRYRNDKVFPKG